MAILGLHGKMRSGKDSVAQILMSHYPENYQRIAFADKLKDSICATFNITHVQLEELKNNPESIVICGQKQNNQDNIISALSMRELLQRFGTEGHRNIFGTNFWVDQALENLPNLNSDNFYYIITDCRFENEINRIHELGGIVVNIKREVADSVSVQHSSEQTFPELCDYTIENNGSLEELYTEILKFLYEYKSGNVLQ